MQSDANAPHEYLADNANTPHDALEDESAYSDIGGEFRSRSSARACLTYPAPPEHECEMTYAQKVAWVRAEIRRIINEKLREFPAPRLPAFALLTVTAARGCRGNHTKSRPPDEVEPVLARHRQ